MFFQIEVSSKNKNSLQNFLNFIFKIKDNTLIVSYLPKQKLKKIVTVLKSPHVDKSAQEHFEYRVYTKKLSINSLRSFKFIYLLKKIQNTCFPGINFKIEIFSEQKKIYKHLLLILNPDNLDLKFFKNFRKLNVSNLKLNKYFRVFETYGELVLKNKFL